MSTATQRQRQARAPAILGWAGLALVQLAWHLWLLPPARGAGPVLLLALLPLALPLLALRRLQRALIWTGIVALFYFCHGVAEAWSQPAERSLALAQIAFSLLLIGALGVSARQGRAAR